MPTLPEQIRQALARRDGISEAAMRPLAIAYDVESVRVNERLSNAVALLHKGLRSEAIQLASMQPNAIDAAAMLDFPEFDEWCEILQFLGIRVPTELNRDLADQLGEAIVESQPLEGLLKQHRRLAIARAPLPWRLKVLRRIAQVDTTNSVWEEDIESWESARLKQLDAEVDGAVRYRDLNHLQALKQELTQTAWRLSPDKSLGKRVAAALAELNHETVAAELELLAPQLYDAFCQFDEPAARQALATWNATHARTTSPINPLLLDQVEGAIAWVAEMDCEAAVRAERSVVIGKLESAIDTGADRARLEATYNACSRFDEPPPMELVQRFRLAIEHLDLRAKRRNQAIIAAIGCFAAITIGSIVFWQVSAAHERKVVQAEAQLAGMVEAKKVAEAHSFIEQLSKDSPEVADDVRLKSLQAQVETLVSTEGSRATQFAQYLSQADVQSAADADFSALSKAEGIAVTEEEKAAVYKIRRQYSKWDQEIDATQTKGLLAALTAFRDRLDAVEKLNADAVSTADLANMLGQLEELPKTFPRANSAAKSQIASAKIRTSSLRDSLRQRHDRMQAEAFAIARVVNATSLDKLAENLTESVIVAPNSPLGKEFATVAKEVPHWARAAGWNAFANSVADIPKSGLTTAVANDLAAKEVTLRMEIGANPAEEKTGSWKERIVRYKDRSEILKRVLGELPDTVVADLYTIVESDGAGNRYFSYKAYQDRSRERLKVAQVGMEVVVNESGAVKGSQPLTGPFKVFTEPYDTIQWLTGLHQTAATKFATDWEGEFLKTIGLLRTRPGLDSQLKEMLTQHLLAGACEGSDLLAKSFVDELLLLRSRVKLREFWFDPAPLEDKLSGEVEALVIRKIAEFYRTRPTIEQDAIQLRRRQYRWVGVLIRNESGRMKASVSKPISDIGQLFVARASLSDQNKTDFVLVGSMQAGETVLRPSNADLIPGRPLFFVPQ